MLRSIVCLLLLGLPSSPLAEEVDVLWKRATQLNQIASIQKHLAVVEDVNAATPNGKTALMAAARQGAAAVVRQLLAAGADINRSNHMGGSPLMYGAGSGDLETVRSMVACGAVINHHAVNGWGPLMIAAAKNHHHIVRYLCQQGAAVNTTDIYGWTPLMRAAYEGNQAVVAVLLRQPGIALEAINDHGQTALHLAVIQKREPVVRLLLAAGARQSTDFAGYTPYRIAAALRRQALQALLQQYQH